MPQTNAQTNSPNNSVWSKLGSAPADDEIEVTVMGPGHGECVLVHIGGGKWIVVDSCIDLSDDKSRVPAALLYLRAIGVSVESQVELVVATHWDSDHIGGMAQLVDACKNAQFCCANALLQDQFLQFSERLLTGSAATNGAQISEFKRALEIVRDRTLPIKFLQVGREIKVWPPGSLVHGQSCTLRSLSPSDKEYTLFLDEIATQMPQAKEAKRAAVGRTPNLASVVLHIDLQKTAILLGADMEIHADVTRGWGAAIQDAKDRSLSKANVFKISHHGSHNGHHDLVWSDLLVPQPLCMLAPFGKGAINSRPPTNDDIARIQALAPKSFITARRTSPENSKRIIAVENGLRESNIKMINKRRPLGIVRFRRKLPGEDWKEELFGPACHISEHDQIFLSESDNNTLTD